MRHPALILLLLTAACMAPPDRADEAGLRTINGESLYVRVIGTGPAVVLVHGGPGLDHTYLLPGMEPLADEYRLILYDQRASGRSGGVGDSVAISLDTFIADLDSLRAAFGLERMTVLGHSFGAYLAMAYAIEHPDRLDALVLASPVEPGRRFAQQTGDNQARRRTADDRARMADLAASEAFQAADPEAVAEFFRVNFLSTFHDRASASRLTITFTPGGAKAPGNLGRWLFRDRSRFDLWARLRAIDARTLVVHGRSDPIPAEMVEALTDSIPGAQLRWIEDAGHFPYLENPEPYFAVIREFLRAGP